MLTNIQGKTMEFNGSSSSYSSSTKVERKVIEKNRRNQMKALFSKLNSLLPDHNTLLILRCPSFVPHLLHPRNVSTEEEHTHMRDNLEHADGSPITKIGGHCGVINEGNLTKDSLPLPDRIDEAINYIKSFEDRLNKSNKEKESLKERKTVFDYTNCEESTSSSRSPQLEIKELGSALEIVLVTGLNSQIRFNEVVRILHEESIEVVNASFSAVENSIFHVVHGQMKEYMVGFGAAKMRERLNRYINGSTKEVEIEHELGNFEDIDPITWQF